LVIDLEKRRGRKNKKNNFTFGVGWHEIVNLLPKVKQKVKKNKILTFYFAIFISVHFILEL
jgi:hypothetical protein